MQSSHLVHFALPGFEALLPRHGSGEVGEVAVDRFANGELRVTVGTKVAGRRCLLIGSTAPPDEQLLVLTLTADALKRRGAARAIALLPYLGYARQDKPRPGGEPAIPWVGALLRASGVDELIAIDVHSDRAAELLAMPVASLSPAELFAAEIGRLGLERPTLVAPDRGAIARSLAVAKAMGGGAPVAHLRKERTAAGVVHHGVVGEVGRSAVVIDDILDTGGTLVSCCHLLRRAGVEEIRVMVTHGLFSGETWHELLALVDGIWVTDTIPALAAAPPPGVRVLSVRPLIEQALGA